MDQALGSLGGARVQLGQRQRRPAPERREGVAGLPLDPLDQPFPREAPEGVAHLAGRVRRLLHPEERRGLWADPPVGDPLGGEPEETERGERGHDPRLAELEAGRRLALMRPAGQDEGLELRLPEAAVVGGALRLIEVDTGHDPLGDDPGREPAGRPPGDPAVEEQVKAVRAAEVEVVAEDLLEELRPRCGRSKTWVRLTSSRRIESA